MILNPNLRFRKFMKAAIDAAETDLLANSTETNKCGWCKWYHPENETCQKMKASTGGSGYVTDYHRHHCSFAEPKGEKE